MLCRPRTPAAALLVTAVFSRGLYAPAVHARPADTIEGARQLFVSAEADEDADRWTEALEKLRSVAQVKLTPGVRYHIALCEEHLGRLVSAFRDYRAAEEQGRVESAKDVLRLVGKQLADLEPRTPRLSVRMAPAIHDASVKIDGEPVADAQAGTPVLVDPGEHRVDSSAPGRVGATAFVTLQEHETRVLDVNLAEISPPPERPKPSASTSTAAPAPISHASPPPSGNHAAAFVATGAALALAGAGAAAYLAADAEHDHGRAACAIQTGPCSPWDDAVRAWDWASAAAWGGAVAAGVVAVVLLAKPSPAAPRAGGASWVIGPTALGVSGRF